ncbi:MAG: hypothetical protein ACI9MR_002700 [Myxococcota bacterium]|jgi:hypothetical protein
MKRRLIQFALTLLVGSLLHACEGKRNRDAAPAPAVAPTPAVPGAHAPNPAPTSSPAVAATRAHAADANPTPDVAKRTPKAASPQPQPRSVVLESCKADPAPVSWLGKGLAERAIVAATKRAAGWFDLDQALTVELAARGFVRCRQRAETAHVGFCVGPLLDEDGDQAGCLTVGLDALAHGPRRWIRLMVTPVSDYKITIYEVRGTELHLWYDGFDVATLALCEGPPDWDYEDDYRDVPATTRREWATLDPAVHRFVCSGVSLDADHPAPRESPASP